MPISTNDRRIIRELAQQLAEIAALPVQQDTIALWKSINGLKPVRPMVMIDQIPWNEMDVDGELVLHTEDPFCRGLEERFRRTLYCWNHMRADMVVDPFVGIGKVIRGTDFGIDVIEETAQTDPTSGVLGHLYIDQMKTDEDIERIQTPRVELDEKATVEAEAKAHDLLDGILEVRMDGAKPAFAAWDRIITWRGAENAILDLAMRPDFTHRLMTRYTEASLALLDRLEDQGLLGTPQTIIHCSGAYTDELPAPGYNPEHPRAKDLWTCGMAQIFSTVSPAMHQEFELDYAVKWYERFGLVYYGCCEPLDGKIDIIRDIPHVRKISMSPWVDLETGAERIGPDFVFSRKPNPAFVAGNSWDPGIVERDLRNTLDTCTRHGCPLEFILKDISTVGYEPQRLWQWNDIAKRVVEG